MKKTLIFLVFLFLCATVSAQSITLTAQTESPTCKGLNNGSIDLTVTGGTPPYSFSWSNGSGDEDPGGLVAGSYTVDVQDADGNSQFLTVQVQDPVPVNFDIVQQAPVLCFENPDGYLQVQGTGGTAPYLYYLNGSLTPNSSGIFENLPAGNYQITVEDANNCSFLATVTITGPAQPLALSNIGKNDPTCGGNNNGSINFGATGGTQPYQFSINGGQNYQPSGSFTGLAAGTYQLMVKDANLCITTIEILQLNTGTPPTVNAGNDATICHTDTFQLNPTVSGGLGTLSYAWQPIAGLSNANIAKPFVRVKNSTTYTLYVTDGAGCTGSDAVTITGQTPDYIGFYGRFALKNNPNSIDLMSSVANQYLRIRLADSVTVPIDTNVSANADFTQYYDQEVLAYQLLTPANTALANIMPTYFRSQTNGAFVIQDATAVGLLTCKSLNVPPLYTTFMVEAETTSGAGVLGGTITKGVNGTGAKAANLRIVLVNAATGNPIKDAVTDAQGRFQFNNLGTAVYKVYVDKPFIDNAVAPTIDLGLQTVQSDLSFQLMPLHLKQNGLTDVTEENLTAGVQVYPNPATDNFVLLLPQELQTAIVTVFDLSGKKIFSSGIKNGAQISCANWPKGLYSAQISANGSQTTKKLMVK